MKLTSIKSRQKIAVLTDSDGNSDETSDGCRHLVAKTSEIS